MLRATRIQAGVVGAIWLLATATGWGQTESVTALATETPGLFCDLKKRTGWRTLLPRLGTLYGVDV